MSKGSLEEQTRANLTLSLAELGLTDGQEIIVADQTNPNTITIKLKFAIQEIEMDWKGIFFSKHNL